MGNRSRVIFGSLFGAATIHLTMLACSSGGGDPPGRDAGGVDVMTSDAGKADDRHNPSGFDAMFDVVRDALGGEETPTRDAGGIDVATTDTTERDAGKGKDRPEPGGFDAVVDAVRDAIGSVVDAEIRDAHAGGGDAGTDAGTPSRTCDCLPPQPEHTVSFTLTAADGTVIRPVAGFTTAETKATRQPGNVDFPAGFVLIESSSSFYTSQAPFNQPVQVTLRCSALVRANNFLLPTGARPSCGLNGQIALGSTIYTFDGGTGAVPDIEVLRLTETQVEYRIVPRYLVVSGGTRMQFTITGLTFRSTVPGARFLTPFDAFRAPTP